MTFLPQPVWQSTPNHLDLASTQRGQHARPRANQSGDFANDSHLCRRLALIYRHTSTLPRGQVKMRRHTDVEINHAQQQFQRDSIEVHLDSLLATRRLV